LGFGARQDHSAEIEMGKNVSDERNAEQAAYWNGPVGKRRTDRQHLQDQMLAPVSAVLFERAAIARGESVLDIGCGCGDTTIEIAKRVGPKGRALGLDISAVMLARARERTPADAPIAFVEGDATTYVFTPAFSADLLFSRFGVMFFAEPVRAFANMRVGLKRGGRVVFACWREPPQNPWMLVPLQAAARHVPPLPEVGPEDPGPFAFASQERVQRILTEAGFSEIVLVVVDLSLDLAVGRGLEAAVENVTKIGPVSRALQEKPAELVAAARESVREALAPFEKGNAVALAGAIWLTTARA
jgi:ubiquinone/menaquinone biosynthesis C-methylase UbiE